MLEPYRTGHVQAVLALDFTCLLDISLSIDCAFVESSSAYTTTVRACAYVLTNNRRRQCRHGIRMPDDNHVDGGATTVITSRTEDLRCSLLPVVQRRPVYATLGISGGE